MELSSEVLDLARELAARRGKSLEQFLVDVLVRELDPVERVEAYLKLFEKVFV